MPISTTGSSTESENSGFTLLELLVVMALAAMMISFAVPNIRSALYTDPLKSTARRLTGLVAEAGQDAVATHTPRLLVYDAAKRTFRLETAAGENGDSGKASSRLAVPEAVQVTDIMSVHGGTRSSGRMEIRFSSQGYVDKTLIHLRDDDGREMTLVLSPFLGVSRILAGYLDLESDQVRW